MTEKTIELSKPVALFENEDPRRIVSLREPTGGDYLDLGEPRILAVNAEGTSFWFEDKAAIKSYLSRCFSEGDHFLRLMSIQDIRKVREALFSFFSLSAPTTSGSSSTS